MGDDFDVVGRLVIQDDGSVVIEKVNSEMDGMKNKAGEVGNAFSNLGSIANFVWGSLIVKGIEMAGQAITDFAKDIVKAGEEGQLMQAQLQAVLQSTGAVAGVTAEQVNQLAGAFARTTKFSDDTVVGAENLLLTFTKIGKDIFPVATQTVLDMSQALGEDTKSAAIQLGKALQDPILGITALRRVGVNFSDDQKTVIERMVKTGDLAGAQAAILKELQTEFGGSAEAAGQTFAGSLAILSNELDMVKEGLFNMLSSSPLVQDFFGALIGGTDSVLGLIDNVNILMKAVKMGADPLAAFGIIFKADAQTMGDVKTIFADVSGLFNDFNTGNVNKGLEDLGKISGDLFGIFTRMVKGIDWGGIGKTIGGAFGGINYQSIFDTALSGASGLGDSFISIMKKIDWKKVGDTITAGINSVDWNKVGQDAKGLQELGKKLIGQLEQGIGIGLSKINWGALAGAIGHGFAQLVAGMVGGDWDKAIAGWQKFIDGAITHFQDSWSKGIAGWQKFLSGAITTFTTSWNNGIHGWQTFIDGAIKTFTTSWDNGIKGWQTFFGGAVSSLSDLINGLFMGALLAATNILSGPMFSAFFGIYEIIQKVEEAVRQLAKALAKLVLPADLKPGSPTPFENGLRGIHTAMNDLTRYALPQLNASFAVAPISPAGGSTTRNYIGGANNSRQSQHIGPVNNYITTGKPSPTDTLKALRKPGA